MTIHGLQTEAVFATHSLPTDRKARRIMRRIARKRAHQYTNIRIATGTLVAIGGMLVSVLP